MVRTTSPMMPSKRKTRRNESSIPQKGSFLREGLGGGRFLTLCLLILAGCSNPQPSVYVDLNLVTQGEQIPNVQVVPTPTPPPSFGSSSLTFPALPAAEYSLSSDQQRIKDVQNVIAANRAALTQEIRDRLQATYTKKIEHTIEQEKAKLPQEILPAYEEALTKTNLIFQDYATKRAPMIIRLALLAGFPDPDPQSQRVPPRSVPAIRRRFEEAKGLRAKIAALDAQYKADVAGVYGAVAGRQAQSYARIEAERARLLREAEAQAIAEATKEVGRKQADLTSALANKQSVSFPAEPGRTITVQGSKNPPPPPTVEVPGKAEMTSRLRQAEESDLQIWAAIKGYVISSDRRGARDATAEFIQWRRTHLALR